MERRIGVAGFCLGGRLAYEISTMFAFSAAVPFLWVNPKSLDALAMIAGPVLGIYAGEDDWVNPGVPVIENMIKTFEMKLYRVQYAFFKEGMPTYDKSAAEDAWQKAGVL
jgi:carboxymethylenebutenolidase